MFAKQAALRMVLCVVAWADVGATDQAKASKPARTFARRASRYAYKLDFSTFLGGSDFEDVRGLTLDAQGNIYVCGPTKSRDFPTTPGAYMAKVIGESSGERGHQLVAKFSPTGKMIWSTLLGNPKACEFPICMNVKVDAAGFVYVSGGAGPGLPTTPGVFQPKFQPGAPNNANAFVAKLKPLPGF